MPAKNCGDPESKRLIMQEKVEERNTGGEKKPSPGTATLNITAICGGSIPCCFDGQLLLVQESWEFSPETNGRGF